jgi:sugar lactone lactonase YvrE
MRSRLGYAKRSALITALLCIWQVAPLLAQTPTPTPTQAPLTVYVSDYSFGGVLKFDEAGQMTIFASGINNPQGLALDDSGNLYVAVYRAVYKYDPSGVIIGSWGGGYLDYGAGLALDSNGVLDVSTVQSLVRIQGNNQTIFLPVFPDRPHGLAFDRSGNLYATASNGGLYKNNRTYPKTLS